MTTAPMHIHPAGNTCVVKIEADYPGPAVIQHQWQDFRGQPLTDLVPLPRSQFVSIESPGSEVVYYRVVFDSIGPNVSLSDWQSGDAREYGFVNLPAESCLNDQADRASPFGMVHAAVDNPHLQGWMTD